LIFRFASRNFDNFSVRSPRQGRRITAQRNALGKKSPLKLRALQGQCKRFPLPLQGAFSGNANPARRKIDRADFPLGWAVTLCRFAANLLIKLHYS
jgi:hypothetical protein